MTGELRTSYLVDQPVFPFCKGCGHTTVLRSLNEALVSLQLRPQETVLVTDIGCIGLADKMFREIHTVHTTHGRSTAFATGIALADSVLADRKLKVMVLIGDGGAMIGLQHLVHAAMLNVNLTVLICNNFVYGMTGGQGSGLTPECFVTATTPQGNVVPPVDLCEILRHSNAPFVARMLATDQALSGTLRDAIASPGFAAVEILELCPEYAVKQNELNGAKLAGIAEKNHWRLGRITERTDREPYCDRIPPAPEVTTAAETRGGHEHGTHLRHPVSVVIAGSAGERVQSSAALICTAVVRLGAFATQKNDNPVTQGTGFSMSEIRLSPDPIGYTGIEHPDVLLVTSADGWREVRAQGWLNRLGGRSRFVVDVSIEAGESRGTKMPFRKVFGEKFAALGALVWALQEEHLLESAFWQDAVAQKFGPDAVQRVHSGIQALQEQESGR